jgi:hypothetical protein
MQQNLMPSTPYRRLYIARLVKQYGLATVQEINHRPQAVELRAQSQSSPCGTYGGNVALAQGFLRVLPALPLQYHSSNTPRPYFIHLQQTLYKSNYKVYAYIVKHNYICGMLFTICKAQLHVSATNVGHLQVVQ